MATNHALGRLTRNPPVLTAVVIGGLLTLAGLLAPLVAGPNDPFIVFGRNYRHDVVHVATGLAGLAAGYYAGGKFARQYAIGLGVAYLFVAVAGVVFIAELRPLLEVNTADNALHMLLAIVLLSVGLVFGDEVG